MLVIRNKYLPFKQFKAINLLGVVFMRPEAKASERLLNHERIHTRQMLEMLVVGFYLWYLIEWLIRLLQPGNAYRNISFEREAFDNEHNLNYLSERKPYTWMRYIIRTHHAIHLLAILFLLLTGCKDQDFQTYDSTATEISLLPQCSESNGSLKETGVNDPAPSMAIIRDTRDAFRFNHIRPQRLLPSQGNAGKRLIGKHPFFSLNKSIHLRHDGRRRQESSPFRTFVSSDYYVIALRHIVR